MPKQILIDTYFGLVRTALTEGSALLDYYEEPPEQGRTKGNIYKATVKKVEAHLQAAFLKYGSGRDGFLPLRDAASAGDKAPKPGDQLIVQVVKDEVGEKGAALTTRLSLAGRYLVLMPGKDGSSSNRGEGGISSRIGEEDRAELKKTMSQLQIPEDASVILRTAALHKLPAELQADLDRLTETYREIRDEAARRKEPGLIFREAPPALRYLREYYAPDVDRIWVNQEETLEECRKFFFVYEPKSASKVALSQDGPLLFHRLGLEAEVEKLSLRRVGLPSGANIVIDQTEALVAIDVNSAKSKDEDRKDLEETVFAINKEAAVEIARQLRLRDLGGIIIVDFIDMEEERHRRQVEELMRKSLASDKAKVKVFDISPLGTLQISRQRLRKAGPHFTRLPCDTCQGRGFHVSPSVAALAALRKMEEKLNGRKAASLSVSAPYPVANQLMNEFREHVLALERRYGCRVTVSAVAAQTGEAVVTAAGGEAVKPQRAKPAVTGDEEEIKPKRGRRKIIPPPAPVVAETLAPVAGPASFVAEAQGPETARPDHRRVDGRPRRGRSRRGNKTAASASAQAPQAVVAQPRIEAREERARAGAAPAAREPREGQPRKRSRRRRGRGGRGGGKPPSQGAGTV